MLDWSPNNEETEHRYPFLNHTPETEFDDLARLAARVCGAPMAAIVFTDNDRLWPKAQIGIDLLDQPHALSLCRKLIRSADLLHDSCFPGPQTVRSFFGVPLVVPDGAVVGALCVLDQRPLVLSIESRELLRVVARSIVAQLDLQHHLTTKQRMAIERKQAEEALRASEKRLRDLLEHCPTYICAHDMKGTLISVNPVTAFHLGYAVEEMNERNLCDFIPQAFRRLLPVYLNRIRRQQTDRGVLPVVTRGGEQLLWEYQNLLYEERDQKPFVLAYAQDVTKRKRAEALLRGEQRILELIASGQPLTNVLMALARFTEHQSPEAQCAITLLDKDGLHLCSIVSPSLPQGFKNAIEGLRIGPRAGSCGTAAFLGREIISVDISRDSLWAGYRDWIISNYGIRSCWSTPILSTNGAVLGTFAMYFSEPRAPRSRDLELIELATQLAGLAIERHNVEAEQKQLQDNVTKAAREWRLTFDAMESPILILSPEGRILRLNQATIKLVGKSYEEILGSSIAAMGERVPWQQAVDLVSRFKKTRASVAALTKDEASGQTWEIKVGQFLSTRIAEERLIVIMHDVTERARLQESLRRSETMSAMGTLVAGVAHEVRNPLFSISVTLDAFEARFGGQREYEKYLQTLRGEVNRMSRLMQELLEYGKPPCLDIAYVSLGEVIAQAVENCSGQADAAKVLLSSKVPDKFGALTADRQRLVRAFENLLENAIHHSPQEGSVMITARLVQRAKDSWLECKIVDQGPGFDSEDLPKIFEPFFTRRHGGVGLGLSIVQRIIDAHGGKITAGNRRKSFGAALTVKLPVGNAISPSRAKKTSKTNKGRVRWS